MNIFKFRAFWSVLGATVLVMCGVDLAVASVGTPVPPITPGGVGGLSMGKLTPAHFPLIGKDIPNILELAMPAKLVKAVFVIIGSSIGIYSVVQFGINADKPDPKSILLGVFMAGVTIAIGFFGIDSIFALGINQIKGY